MNKRVAQGQLTRERLVTVAEALFAEHGFDGTSIDAVLDAANISRGSLYHHFSGKDALFEAVLLEVEERIGAATVAAGAGATTARDALRAGCLAWVRLAGDPVVQRIVLTDAQAVLGWRRWREIEEAAPLGLLKAAMRAAAAEGDLPPHLADVYAHMLLATMNELALFVVRAASPDEAQLVAQAAIDDLLSRLFPNGPQPKAGRTSPGAAPNNTA